jgi:hypothetical protein
MVPINNAIMHLRKMQVAASLAYQCLMQLNKCGTPSEIHPSQSATLIQREHAQSHLAVQNTYRHRTAAGTRQLSAGRPKLALRDSQCKVKSTGQSSKHSPKPCMLPFVIPPGLLTSTSARHPQPCKQPRKGNCLSSLLQVHK